MKNFYKIIASIIFLPNLTLAFSLKDSTFSGIITEVREIIALLLPLMIAAAFLFFFWGLTKFILNSNNEKEIETGKKYMIWGVLALFVLFTFRSIITLISNDLEIGDSTTLPLLPEPGGHVNSGFNPKL
jgi:hypothetical protein